MLKMKLKELQQMAKMSSLKLDNWSKGLLISIISKAISGDREMTPDDIEKLKEIKKQLQEIQEPDKKNTDKD